MGNEWGDRHESLVAEAQARAEARKAGEGYFYAVRTRSRLRDDGSGWAHSENIDDHVVRVVEFRTTPARVKVSKGLTINLGQYESARVTIGFEIPCYVEEMAEVADAAERMVEDRICREVLAIRGKDIRPGHEAKRQAPEKSSEDVPF